MRIVSNSSPLIGLSMVGKYRLLKELYSEVLIPNAVYEEVIVKGTGRPGHTETGNALKEGWIRRVNVKDTLAVESLLERFNKGEAEAIILGKEEKADAILLDDLKARNEAEFMELAVIGTIGILKLAKKKGMQIDLKKALDKLRKEGFRIDDELYEKVAKVAEEKISIPPPRKL